MPSKRHNYVYFEQSAENQAALTLISYISLQLRRRIHIGRKELTMTSYAHRTPMSANPPKTSPFRLPLNREVFSRSTHHLTPNHLPPLETRSSSSRQKPFAPCNQLPPILSYSLRYFSCFIGLLWCETERNTIANPALEVREPSGWERCCYRGIC